MRTGECGTRQQGHIKACLFDLDGTLIDSEPLKTQSHVRTVLALANGAAPAEGEIADAVNRLIGVPTRETAVDLIARFGLEREVLARQKELGLDEPWEAYSALQHEHYRRIVEQPGTLVRRQFPGAVALLKRARELGLKTALGSMSFRRDVERTLAILGWTEWFDVVLTGDEVSRGKPDPEIYLSLAARLKVRPPECLVLEDSPSGIGAALAAGMVCVAVPNELTRKAVLAMQGLAAACLVLDQARLLEKVEQWLPEFGRAAKNRTGSVSNEAR